MYIAYVCVFYVLSNVFFLLRIKEKSLLSKKKIFCKNNYGIIPKSMEYTRKKRKTKQQQSICINLTQKLIATATFNFGNEEKMAQERQRERGENES